MTAEQFERWKDVSVRFARNGWPNMTEARKARLALEIEGFLDNVEEGERYLDVKSWDSGDICICDWFMEAFGETWQYGGNHPEDGDDRHSRFLGQLACCLRIGLDLAAEPSAGVLGFDKGDLERCFNGEIPDWIVSQFDGLAEAPSDTGVLL